MKQSEFDKVFSPKFLGFTSRMWLDYCDENNNPFAKTIVSLSKHRTN